MAFSALTFDEMKLFAKSGEDMRLHDWPQGHFVRWIQGPTPIEGYTCQPYTPTASERASSAWEKA